MKKAVLYLIFLLFSCNSHSKWETIYGKAIDDEPKTIDNVIYFENENSGVVGGYELVDDNNNAQYGVRLSQIPKLYLTSDGGKNWKEIYFESIIKQSIRNAYLHLDTLICQTDSLILFSLDKGNHLKILHDSVEVSFAKDKFKNNQTKIDNDNFKYKGNDYIIKEFYQNNLISVIVCYGPETMTDYYFVSYDNQKNWSFLQKNFGDNRQRFLLEDKYLYRYNFPFGLQRLKLK